MAYPLPENMSAGRKRAVEELILGRKFTHQLREVLKSGGRDNNRGGEELVVKILESFNACLSMLESVDSGEVSQAAAPGSPSCDGGRKSEDSSGSVKTSAAVKDGRGCYKRRKTGETIIKESHTLVDDGHAWRKYGQKYILNAPYPRNYYRCTHKYDCNCHATKQVQRVKENPPLYRTTYHGYHTCANFQKCPQIILDSTAPRDTSFLLSFGQNGKIDKEANPGLIKKENKLEFGETLSHHDHHSHIQSSSSGCFQPSDDRPRSPVENSGHGAPAVSSASEYGDVISSGCTLDLDMHMIGGNADIDDFTFDSLEFLKEFC